jgi:acyl-coenzyme A synthetase/AMP-(fatty) acid ligase
MSLVPLSRVLSGSRPEDAVIAWRGDQAVRFGQFRAMACAVAASAIRGQRVALICRDSIYFAAGLLGLIQAGAEIVLPANDHPALLAAMSGTFQRSMDAAAVLAASGAMPPGPVAADAIPVTFFTSGSTGKPKPITRSLAMLEHEVAGLNTEFGGFTGSGRILATVSHQQLYGLIFKLLWPLSAGRASWCPALRTSPAWVDSRRSR